MGVVRRNRAPMDSEPHILEMPECKRGRFLKSLADTDGCGQYVTNNSSDVTESGIEDVTNNSNSVTNDSNSVTNNSNSATNDSNSVTNDIDDVISNDRGGFPQFINNQQVQV